MEAPKRFLLILEDALAEVYSLKIPDWISTSDAVIGLSNFFFLSSAEQPTLRVSSDSESNRMIRHHWTFRLPVSTRTLRRADRSYF